MKLRLGLLIAGLLSLAGTTPAWALELFDTGASALTLADPTQLGRLSRGGVPQDWSGTEAFPGILNTTTSYHYRTFDVAITDTPYVQIEMDSVSTNIFASAYLDSYSPTNLMANWLGDAGFSGNQFGNPLFFQVIVPVGHTLVVAVNNTAGGGLGLYDPFDVKVEGFIDTQFTDPIRGGGVPEPATWAMMMAGFLGIGALARRRGAMARMAN